MGIFDKVSYWARSQQSLADINNPDDRFKHIALDALEHCIRNRGMQFNRNVIGVAEMMLVNEPDMKIGRFVEIYEQAQKSRQPDTSYD